jgi:hypothetical protein
MNLNSKLLAFLLSLFFYSNGFAQISNFSNIIFIDVNSLVNPRNCNSELSDQQIRTSSQRCISEIRKIILQKPNEIFLIVYLNDNENKSHFYRECSAKNGEKYFKDSLANFKNISSSNIEDNSKRINNLILKLNDWDIDISSFSKLNLLFFVGCDVNQAENIKIDYVYRFLKLTGLIEIENLKIRSGIKSTLYINNGNNKFFKEEKLFNYETKSF